MGLNWRLTLIKGLVVGGLATLAIWGANIQGVEAWWGGLAAVGIETVRDLIKTRFGSFVPAAPATTDAGQ
jgi:hypothetical protein